MVLTLCMKKHKNGTNESISKLVSAQNVAILEPNVGILIPRLGSKTIRQAVGVVGCVIIPQRVSALRHSALVQSRKIDESNKGQVQEALNYYSIKFSDCVLLWFICLLNVELVAFLRSGVDCCT